MLIEFANVRAQELPNDILLFFVLKDSGTFKLSAK